MKTTRDLQDLVKMYERDRGLSFRDSMQCALNQLIEEERERCAKIAENAAIPGHSVQEPSCREIAKKIREG